MKKTNNTIIDLTTYKKMGLDIDIESVGDITKKEKNYPYDIGVNIYDYETKKVVKAFSLIINEIFNDDIKMDSAFFKNKIPFYNNMLDIFNENKESNYYKCVNINEALNIINVAISKFKIQVVGAFNARFDYEGVNYLYDLRPSIKNKFSKLKPLDIRLMFLQYLKDQPRMLKKFKEFCKETNRKTEKGFCSTTAETAYCFLFSTDFQEKHTGLEDLKIETKIKSKLISLYKKNKKPFLYDLSGHKLGVSLYKGENALLRID